jgi:hypothetical protein
LLGRAAAQEPVGPVLGGDDLRAGGEVEVGLAGVAQPDAVAGADLVVGGQVNGDGLVDAAAGGSSPGGAVRAGGGEGGERAGKVGGGCAGEVGERIQGLGCGDEHVVLGAVAAVAGLRGEPGGQDGEHLGEGEVVGVGEPGQVGDEHLSGDRGDRSRQGRRVGGKAGGPGRALRSLLPRLGLPAAGWGQQATRQPAVEGRAASGQTLTIAVSDTTLAIELDDAETRVVRPTTTPPVCNIKADRPWTA